MPTDRVPDVRLLSWSGCPSHDAASALLQDALRDVGRSPTDYIEEWIETDDEAERAHFVGSPTITVDGHDIDPPPSGSPPGLTCRIYKTMQGKFSPLPEKEKLLRALIERGSESTMTESFDVVIVGSGPVGSTYARTLLDIAPETRVLLLESGPQVAEPAGRHVKTLVDPADLLAAQIKSQGPTQTAYPSMAAGPGRRANAPLVARPGTFLLGPTATSPGEDGMPAAAMSSNVGGMGSHWTCACPYPGEGERIPFIPVEEFDEVFARSWELLHTTQSAFDNAPLGAEVRAVLGSLLDEGRPESRRVQPMPLGIEVDSDGNRYWTGTDVILGDLLKNPPPGFELRADSVVTKVLIDNDRATGVVVNPRDGEQYTVHARAVVVAADALRSPQILFASGVRLPALGHYLNEHPQVLALATLSPGFYPEEEVPARTPTGVVDALSGVNWIPYDRERFPFHGQIMQQDASPVPIEAGPEPRPGAIVGLGFFCTKDVQPDDRLEFDENTLDWQGLPQIRIHYNLTEKDHETLAQAQQVITGLAEALGGLVNGAPPIVMPAGSSLHYMGTTRMGELDDGTSVCDVNSRVWGFSNLWVGGNGVIPTSTACNPTATSVALAVRGARQIAATLNQKGHL